MTEHSALPKVTDDGIIAICLEMRPGLMRFLEARGAASHEAEDLVQEIMLKLSAQPTGPIADPKAYLYKMAHNIFIDRRRSAVLRKRREDHWHGAMAEPNPEADRQPSIETILIDRERLAFVRGRLAMLPERTVDILRRYRLDGEPQKDIACAHGISVSAVEKHLQRAYRLIMDAREDLDAENADENRLSIKDIQHEF
ncbi:MAG: RNA polymerase sigma factor [Alphaproteobacteria bacterium]|nr:RNA polymerase sigma factor [Alphaproteobacteria bacterium]